MKRLLLPAGILVMLAGYFGPWIDHRVAGLVITGLDLGEYVKFLPGVQTGEIALWRPGFYAPLVAASATALLFAFRIEGSYHTWQRVLFLGIAAVAMLNLAPPAWTPRRLLQPEFRVQAVCLLTLALMLVLSPWLAFAPCRIVIIGTGVLLACAAILPAQGFFAVLPAIADLYQQSLGPGLGLWVMWLGVGISGFAVVMGLRRPSTVN